MPKKDFTESLKTSIIEEVKKNLHDAKNVAENTIKVLESVNLIAMLNNKVHELKKQPKIYLWDWSLVADEGARRENLVASHLLKAAQAWTDIGLGDYGLHYLRDKAKREVDFLVTRDGTPWFMVEVKTSGRRDLNPALRYFQQQTDADHAFQVAFNLDYVDVDCFSQTTPVRVPAETLLSQLV